MTNQEALTELKASIEGCGFQCHKETYEMAIEALEKQVPVKRYRTRTFGIIETNLRSSICPVCLSINITNEKDYPKYCNWCGQAIDWESEVD